RPLLVDPVVGQGSAATATVVAVEPLDGHGLRLVLGDPLGAECGEDEAELAVRNGGHRELGRAGDRRGGAATGLLGPDAVLLDRVLHGLEYRLGGAAQRVE